MNSADSSNMFVHNVVDTINIRQEDHAIFAHQKMDVEDGLQGVNLTLKIHRECYPTAARAQSAPESVAIGIIGLLEVGESDFTRSLADIIATKEVSATERALPSKAGKFGDPPFPAEDLPTKEPDKAFADKTKACASCKFHTLRSGAMYKTCSCFAANTKSLGHTSGSLDTLGSDDTDGHGTCNGDTICAKHTACLPATAAKNADNLDDAADPHNPICL